jgi:hypothetical protein
MACLPSGRLIGPLGPDRRAFGRSWASVQRRLRRRAPGWPRRGKSCEPSFLTSLCVPFDRAVARGVCCLKRHLAPANRPSKRRRARNGKYNFTAGRYHQGAFRAEGRKLIQPAVQKSCQALSRELFSQLYDFKASKVLLHLQVDTVLLRKIENRGKLMPWRKCHDH